MSWPVKRACPPTWRKPPKVSWKCARSASPPVCCASAAPSRAVFLCMAGAGLDAEIVYHLNLDLKAAFGKFAYYVGGFSRAFYPLNEFEVIVDGQRHEASFALISRVRNYGGDLEIARGLRSCGTNSKLCCFAASKV